MTAYKFVNWEVGPKPTGGNVDLLEKAQRRENLTRQEKDRIAEILYGPFGANGPTYKLGGWAWSMNDVLPRILVKFSFDRGFDVYYAPDKTSLRKTLEDVYPGKIDEMIYAPVGGDHGKRT